MANLTAYIFGTKHAVNNRSSALTTTMGLLHLPKMSWTLVYKRLQTQPAFYPPSVYSAFHGSPLLKKMGPKNFYICSVFLRLRDLMANICWMKHDIDNWARALQSTKSLLCCLKISWTLVYKQLKTGLEFLPILTILFCSSPSHTL